MAWVDLTHETIRPKDIHDPGGNAFHFDEDARIAEDMQRHHVPSTAEQFGQGSSHPPGAWQPVIEKQADGQVGSVTVIPSSLAGTGVVKRF